jgi:hypothetical protein
MKSKKNLKLEKQIEKLVSSSAQGNNGEGIEKEAEPSKELNEIPLCWRDTKYRFYKQIPVVSCERSVYWTPCSQTF